MAFSMLRLIGRRPRRRKNLTTVDSYLDSLYERVEKAYGYLSPIYGEEPGPLSYRRVGRTIFPGFQFHLVNDKFGAVRAIVHDLLRIATSRGFDQTDLIRWLCEHNEQFHGGRPVDLLEGEPEVVLLRAPWVYLPLVEQTADNAA